MPILIVCPFLDRITCSFVFFFVCVCGCMHVMVADGCIARCTCTCMHLLLEARGKSFLFLKLCPPLLFWDCLDHLTEDDSLLSAVRICWEAQRTSPDPLYYCRSKLFLSVQAVFLWGARFCGSDPGWDSSPFPSPTFCFSPGLALSFKVLSFSFLFLFTVECQHSPISTHYDKPLFFSCFDCILWSNMEKGARAG